MQGDLNTLRSSTGNGGAADTPIKSHQLGGTADRNQYLLAIVTDSAIGLIDPFPVAAKALLNRTQIIHAGRKVRNPPVQGKPSSPGATRAVPMNTAFLLMAQYGGKAIIPISEVCRDYFPHLNTTKLVQKISCGEIALPLVRIEISQKAARGVHLVDLAKYLDKRVEIARKEMIGSTE